MSVYTINSSSTGYQVLKVATPNMPAQTDNAGNNVSPGSSNVSSNNESFVQSVLQSLQGLGLNTSDVGTGASTDGNAPSSNATEALQGFVQNLYKALQESSQPVSVANSTNVTATDSGTVTSDNVPSTTNSTAIPTKISGGTNFKYTVDFSQADLGDNLANVEANVKTALDNIGQYISSKVVFDLKVLTETTDPNKLAETNSSLLTSTVSQNGANADTTFVTDSIHGVNFYPDVPDATLRINLASLDQMSFSGSPPPDKYDLTSILTHEILHGLAFTGNLGGNATAAALTTTYDSLVTTPETTPMFVGHHAETANAGNPVPLSPSSSGAGSAYYHVAVPSDLMSESIAKGEVRKISALDVAMLEDMGITVTGASPAPSKVQIAYSNSTTNLQNLRRSLNNDTGQNSALQTGFSNLVSSLGGTTSPQVNLQDFLTQLSMNTANANSLQKDSGSFFSATA